MIDRKKEEKIVDEIDTFGLLFILIKRKNVLLLCILISLMLGFVYIYFKEDLYKFTTTLQLGSNLIIDEDSFLKESVESTSNAKLKLENVFIPISKQKLSGKYPDKKFNLSVIDKNNGNVIFLVSKGKVGEYKALKELHTIVVAPLIKDHRDIVAAFKKEYEISLEKSIIELSELESPNLKAIEEKIIKGRIESAELDLMALDDKKTILNLDKKGLLATKKLLDKQIKQIEKNLKISYERRSRALDDVNDEAMAMTFILLNNEIQNNENYLGELRERYFVKIENEKQVNTNLIAENERLHQIQKFEINDLRDQLLKFRINRSNNIEKLRNSVSSARNKLNLFQDTRVLEFTIKSSNPLNSSKINVIALAGLIGIFIGLILIFISEVIVRFRVYSANNNIQDVRTDMVE